MIKIAVMCIITRMMMITRVMISMLMIDDDDDDGVFRRPQRQAQRAGLPTDYWSLKRRRLIRPSPDQVSLFFLFCFANGYLLSCKTWHLFHACGSNFLPPIFVVLFRQPRKFFSSSARTGRATPAPAAATARRWRKFWNCRTRTALWRSPSGEGGGEKPLRSRRRRTSHPHHNQLSLSVRPLK